MIRSKCIPPLLLVALGGCGSSTATLTGKVSYQGHPVTSGAVTALCDDGTAREGVIRPDGTYAIEGIKPGPVKLAVRSPNPARSRSILTASARPRRGRTAAANTDAPGWFPLP